MTRHTLTINQANNAERLLRPVLRHLADNESVRHATLRYKEDELNVTRNGEVLDVEGFEAHRDDQFRDIVEFASWNEELNLSTLFENHWLIQYSVDERFNLDAGVLESTVTVRQVSFKDIEE